MLATFVRADDGARAEALDEREPHVRERRLAVEPALTLKGLDEAGERLTLALGNAELALDQRVAFDHLRRGEAHRQTRCLRIGIDEVHERVNATMNLAERIARLLACGAKVDVPGDLAVHRNVHRVVDKLVDTLVLHRGDGHDGNAERRLELVDAHRAAVRGELVHHVESEHHRDVELHQLQREIKVALDVGRVDDVDDRGGLLLDQEVARHDLLVRVRRERVDAGKVDHRRLGMTAQLALLLVDSDAREVADMLICTCELVEQRGLAAVLVAGERKGDRRALGQGLAKVADVVVPRRAHLADAGMRGRAGQRFDGNGRLGKGLHGLNQGEAGVVEAQRQLVAAQLDLDGVAHRSDFAHAHPDAGRKPHVEQMATQLAVAAHRLDNRALPRLQGVKRGPIIRIMLATCGFTTCERIARR